MPMRMQKVTRRDGTDRPYLLHVPDGLTDPAPRCS